MTPEVSCRSKLTQLMAHHILCNIDRYMRLTIMDANCHSHHLGEDCRSTRPGLDNTAVSISHHTQDFLTLCFINFWHVFSLALHLLMSPSLLAGATTHLILHLVSFAFG